MELASSRIEMENQILCSLADSFEAGDSGRTFAPSEPAEYELLRETLAEMISEELLVRDIFKRHRLTNEGYRHYKPRIDALRTLGKS